MVDARERLRLVPEATDCRPVVDQMRADQLCDDERVQPIVPREVGLVVVSPAELLDRATPGDDGIALAQMPPAVLGIG